MNETFETALAAVLGWEGGYVNDPRDAGGETNFGISARAYPGLNIKSLTRDQAAALYRRDYWDACRCDALPSPLALLVFDAAVNQGPGAAVRMMQEAAGVPEDGRIGPRTLAAAQAPAVVGAFAVARARRYAGARDFPAFGRGWLNRLFDMHRRAVLMGEG